VPKAEDAKHRQPRTSEPQLPSATKPTAVASTLVGSSPAREPGAQRTYRRSVTAAGTYVDCATLLRGVSDADSLRCPRCTGGLRFITAVSSQPTITKILDRVGPQALLPHANRPNTASSFSSANALRRSTRARLRPSRPTCLNFGSSAEVRGAKASIQRFQWSEAGPKCDQRLP
jgi:hypothetical protein